MKIHKSELNRVATEIVAYLQEHANAVGATVLALSGDLGAGKTTLIQEMAKVVGVKESLTSPTFVIMKRYETTHPTFRELVHIDAYRMEQEGEIRALKLNEVYAKKNTLVCIEWPERLFCELPVEIVRLSLTVAGEEERIVTTRAELMQRLEHAIARG